MSRFCGLAILALACSSPAGSVTATDASDRAADAPAPSGSVDARGVDTSAVDAGTTEVTSLPSDTAPPTGGLCSGGPVLRLAVYSSGGSPAAYGTEVLLQNGTTTLLVDGTCRYHVRGGLWNEARTGTLDAQDLERLSAQLRYAEWPRLAGRYCVGAFDLPAQHFWFDRADIVKVPCGSGDTPIRFDPQPPSIEVGKALYQKGSPVDGAARFALVAALPAPPANMQQRYRGAEPWPLASDPRMLTPHVTGMGPQPIPIHRVDGTDAATLRRLRVRMLAGEIGEGGPIPAFIPIKQPSGQLYELYVRDVLPFENDKGVIDAPVDPRYLCMKTGPCQP